MFISLHHAASLLREGHVVAIPTETVYGLAASIAHPEAIQRIFALKGRPATNPLIVHVASRDQCLAAVQELPMGFDALTEAFWPGPLTLVLPVAGEQIPAAARANLPTAAFRQPCHALARELLQAVGPLVAPSANLSGRPSATHAVHVTADFGEELPVLDGGPCSHGVESTILAFDGSWRLARAGAIAPEAIADVLGYTPKSLTSDRPICPGQLFRHYAPRARLLLTESHSHHTVVGFSDRSYQATRVFSIGPSTDPVAVAQQLYATLRKLDEEGVEEAAVDMRFPHDGLWGTLRERLTRASQ